MQYQEICIEVMQSNLELVSMWLFENEYGYEQRDLETLQKVKNHVNAELYVYLPLSQADDFLQLIQKEFPTELVRLESSVQDEKNWHEQWKKFFKVQKIGNLCLVPSWELANFKQSTEDTVLKIDPGRAFGTGLHPTTRLCLQQISTWKINPTTTNLVAFLDVGCGSGILSIAALLLNPALTAIAIDIDPEAVEVTTENAKMNQVEHRLTILSTPLLELAGLYQYIVANLTTPVLCELANDLTSHLSTDGELLLSGILAQEKDQVIEKFLPYGLFLKNLVQEEEWVAIHFKKRLP